MKEKEPTEYQKAAKAARELGAQYEQERKRKAAESKYMRDSVADLELKARYWKAQVEVIKYSMEYANLQPSYDAFLSDQQAQAQAKLEQLKKQQEEHPEQLQLQETKTEG